jgi:hypothetical protein
VRLPVPPPSRGGLGRSGGRSPARDGVSSSPGRGSARSEATGALGRLFVPETGLAGQARGPNSLSGRRAGGLAFFDAARNMFHSCFEQQDGTLVRLIERACSTRWDSGSTYRNAQSSCLCARSCDEGERSTATTTCVTPDHGLTNCVPRTEQPESRHDGSSVRNARSVRISYSVYSKVCDTNRCMLASAYRFLFIASR